MKKANESRWSLTNNQRWTEGKPETNARKISLLQIKKIIILKCNNPLIASSIITETVYSGNFQ